MSTPMHCPTCRQVFTIVGARMQWDCPDCGVALQPGPAPAQPAADHAAPERMALLIFDRAGLQAAGRSAPYKRGLLDTLLHLGNVATLQMPYALGSVQADAWLSGGELARCLWPTQPGAPA